LLNLLEGVVTSFHLPTYSGFALIRSVGPLVGFRGFGQTNVDERELAAADGLERAL
jgi:hypothetical protein